MDDVDAIIAGGSDSEGELDVEGVNLEDILREDDDDTDQYDGSYDNDDDFVKKLGLIGNDNGNEQQMYSSKTDFTSTSGGNGHHQQRNTTTSTSMGLHSDEDWAVLKEILEESELDDTLSTKENQKTFSDVDNIIDNMNSNFDIDNIINSVEKDQSFSNIAATNDDVSSTKENKIESTAPPSITTTATTSLRNNSYSRNSITDSSTTNNDNSKLSSLSSNNIARTLAEGKGFSTSSNSSILNRKNGPTNYGVFNDAMIAAEQREQRLLKPGNKENLMSPLQVKRKTRLKLVNTVGRSSGTEGGSLVKVKSVEAISKQLAKNAQYRKHGPGFPTSVSVHPKFIGIGTSRSLILLFDHFHEIRQVLGSTDDAETHGAVTAIDISKSNDVLISGYFNGRVVLWDFIKGSILKAVTDAHSSPMLSVRFFPSRTSLSVISTDIKGIVNKIGFSKVLWTTYVADTECLLDGAAGQILSLSVLYNDSGTSGKDTIPASNMNADIFERVALVCLSSDKSSFIVSVEPVVKVLYKWLKPSDAEIIIAKESFNLVPCLSWKKSNLDSEKQVNPELCRAWNGSIQILEVKVGGNSVERADGQTDFVPLVFETNRQKQAKGNIVSLEWINAKIIMYLTTKNTLHVLDSSNLDNLENFDLKNVDILFSSFNTLGSFCLGEQQPNKEDESRLNFYRSYHNSFRCGDGRLYTLGYKELNVVILQTWASRVEALIDAGEWLEALALALDHYESDIKPKLSSKGKPFSGQGGIYSATPAEKRVAGLLLRYVNLAMDNAPKKGSTKVSSGIGGKSNLVDFCKSHYQMLCGVCLEYCVTTGRLDLLFGEIFSKFVSADQVSIYLDMLEPYILNNKLTFIAPEVMASFVEHCERKGDLSIIERCLLHMDVKVLDFNHILGLLKKYRLYSASIYVYSMGLFDFISPLELILNDVMHHMKNEWFSENSIEDHTEKQSETEIIVSKALLYVFYCFSDKMFPSGLSLANEKDGKLDASILSQMLNFILSRKFSMKSDELQHGGMIEEIEPYPYFKVLLCIDPDTTIKVFCKAFENNDFIFREMSDEDLSLQENHLQSASKLNLHDLPKICPSREQIYHIFESIIMSANCSDYQMYLKDDFDFDSLLKDVKSVELPFYKRYQSPDAVAAFLLFLSKNIENGGVSANAVGATNLINVVLKYLTSKHAATKLNGAEKAEERLIKLLQRIPINLVDVDLLLEWTKAAEFSRGELVLHKTVNTVALKACRQDPNAIKGIVRKHFAATIDCYLRDQDKEYKEIVFNYVRGELNSHIQTFNSTLSDEESNMIEMHQYRNEHTAVNKNIDLTIPSNILLDEMKQVILEKMSTLFALNKVSAFQLIGELFSNDNQKILEALGGPNNPNPILQYDYLNAIVSGDLEKSQAMNSSMISLSLSNADLQLYVRLMARYKPSDVYHYLTTHDNYPLDECLRICQEYQLTEATSFLLERTGDTIGALNLILKGVSHRLNNLQYALQNFVMPENLIHENDNNNNTNTNTNTNTSNNNTNTSNTTTTTTNSINNNSNDNNMSILTPEYLKRKGTIRRLVFENLDQGKSLEAIVKVAVDICIRNSNNARQNGDEQATKLWFMMLDTLLHANSILKMDEELETQKAKRPASTRTKGNNTTRAQESFLMQAVLNDLMQTVLNSMMGSVPLPEIVRKITSDHAKNTLKDFRDILLNMFESYSYERVIYRTGVNLMAQTLHNQQKQKHRLRGSGVCVRAINGARLSQPEYNYHLAKETFRSRSAMSRKMVKANNNGDVWREIKSGNGSILTVSGDGDAKFQNMQNYRNIHNRTDGSDSFMGEQFRRN